MSDYARFAGSDQSLRAQFDSGLRALLTYACGLGLSESERSHV